MTLYELTFLTKEDADPGVAEAIEAGGGRIASQRSLGRRSLAYPIKKETAAYYTTVRFNGEPAMLEELNRALNLNTGLLRFLVVEVPEIKLEPASLEAGELKEAKELEAMPESTDEQPVKATAADEQQADAETPTSSEDRSKALDEQLGKLLSDEDNQEV